MQILAGAYLTENYKVQWERDALSLSLVSTCLLTSPPHPPDRFVYYQNVHAKSPDVLSLHACVHAIVFVKAGV